MDLYIYYKVDAAAAAELAPRVVAMQARLASAHRVTPALRRRPGEQDGKQTWMEVYPDAPAGFDTAVRQAVEHEGLGALISGARHAEIFVELQACA